MRNYNKNMENQDVLIKKGVIEKKAGMVIFDLEKYQLIKKELGEYRKKERLLRSLKNFEDLAKWGRSFARKKKITPKQVLEND